ncbi:MAG: helix-turn-helix domain-containing protein [Acidobacteria bacterium]|nr:helix-turn-helix domain-containing protein [Acidobacteriota bacterium]
MPTIGDRIKEIREDFGWTQEKLAEEAGLSKGFLSDVENNKRDISSTNVLKIANALGASLEYLMRGEEKKQETREPIQIPVALSKAAEDLDLSYSETLTLRDTYNSIIARRSSKSLKPPTVEEWKHLYKVIKKAVPPDADEAKG